ncbi:DUF4185 domain-containing protein [Fodinicola feengrottensis]|uniref:DUF4185 domain-containing protein n=1 Tax=Fodinicola feengrottensis TaxID=435914 RepID=UPI0024433183|nr:DUF4185 domain-containing protein [Fodinicola feengrottensis]
MPQTAAASPKVSPQLASSKKRLTGVDMPPSQRWQVGGTDLGIAYLLENNSVGFLFGDTFNTRWYNDPPLPNDWRSPVMLRSNIHPGDPGGIVFDSAAMVAGDGRAPEITYNGHNGSDGAGTFEVTVIPNDAVAFPDGTHVMSYMSIAPWYNDVNIQWRTNYAGLAISHDGNSFQRTPTVWWNDGSNTDPFQMWTMQRDGDWVYIFSVRAGRQTGPMMLRRVPVNSMFDSGAYQGWGWNGTNWDWGRPCTSILPESRFGEPSVRRLNDGTWVMSYLNGGSGSIVTRRADGPDKAWTDENVQVTQLQQPAIYGGFIHPYSSSAPNDLHLLVSRWPQINGQSFAYDVTQWSVRFRSCLVIAVG